MTKPQAIIFDFGFVLLLPQNVDAFWTDLDALAARHGIESGRDMWNALFTSDLWQQAKRGQLSEEAFWRESLGKMSIEGDAAIDTFKRELFEHLQEIHPAMRELLDALGASYRLAVLSNIETKNFEQWLVTTYDLDGIFEVIVGSADTGYAKPEPEIYQLVLDRLDLPPDQTLFVDDLRRNTKAAEELGIPSIVFTEPDALRATLTERGIL